MAESRPNHEAQTTHEKQQTGAYRPPVLVFPLHFSETENQPGRRPNKPKTLPASLSSLPASIGSIGTFASMGLVQFMAFAALVVGLFVAVTGAAMLAGHWRTSVTRAEYLERMQLLDRY